MRELEKILEEIKDALKDTYLDIANNYDVSDLRYDSDKVARVAGKFRREASERIGTIIRKCSNDRWIPVEECLPATDEETEETIEDDDCPEYIVTIRETSESTVLKYSPDGTWFDENGYVYDVIAWRHLPEPYHPERSTGK